MSRINAYVLAADPAWVEQSIRSYYDLVDRIVVSFDETGTSWTGLPIDVASSVRRIESIDTQHKVDLLPGPHAGPGTNPLLLETAQRQRALDAASRDADWVLQIDTDELVTDLDALRTSIAAADARAFDGVEYPARNLYQYVAGDRYLEHCRRLWRVSATYPGPIAVRAGSSLRLARQGPASLYRVDFHWRNTDSHHASDSPVHAVVRPEQAIMHYSWVRSVADMRAKTASWGHAHDRDWVPALSAWEQSREQPVRTSFVAEWSKRRATPRLRVARVTGAPGPDELRRNGIVP